MAVFYAFIEPAAMAITRAMRAKRIFLVNETKTPLAQALFHQSTGFAKVHLARIFTLQHAHDFAHIF